MKYMTPAEKKAALYSLDMAIKIVKQLPEERNCQKCLHYNTEEKRCLWWNKEVPAEFLSQGCDKWEWMPF